MSTTLSFAPPPSVLYEGQPPGSVTVTTRDGEAVDHSYLRRRLDLASHSPDGFMWGYLGSGPAQLALALCADLLENDALALQVHQHVKDRLVSQWDREKGWAISGDELWAVIRPLLPLSMPPGQDPRVLSAQLVSTDEGGQLKAEAFTLDELASAMELRGFAFDRLEEDPILRPMLQGQPRFKGAHGPSYGGPGVVRYESAAAYKVLGR